LKRAAALTWGPTEPADGHMSSEHASTEAAADSGAAVADGGTTADGGVVREIGHDEFDPVGTLALILLYLAILVVMWFFMYFVEFLGNGPTVVG